MTTSEGCIKVQKTHLKYFVSVAHFELKVSKIWEHKCQFNKMTGKMNENDFSIHEMMSVQMWMWAVLSCWHSSLVPLAVVVHYLRKKGTDCCVLKSLHAGMRWLRSIYKAAFSKVQVFQKYFKGMSLQASRSRNQRSNFEKQCEFQV